MVLPREQSTEAVTRWVPRVSNCEMEWILSESLPKLAESAVTLEGRESVGRGAKLTGVAAYEKVSVPITTTDIGCRTGLHINAITIPKL